MTEEEDLVRDARVQLAQLRIMLGKVEAAWDDLVLIMWVAPFLLPKAFVFWLLSPLVGAFLRWWIRRYERALGLC